MCGGGEEQQGRGATQVKAGKNGKKGSKTSHRTKKGWEPCQTPNLSQKNRSE